jgi:hypothetical protein
MTEREKLTGCLQSFFRNRHASRPRYKNSNRHPNETVSLHRRHCEMVRNYIRRIRTLDDLGEG